MKAAQRRREARREHTEAIVAQHLSKLFERLPMLTGFWLGAEFELVELSVFAWPGCIAVREVYDEVMRSLLELAAERPDAAKLMPGRTFARAVH